MKTLLIILGISAAISTVVVLGAMKVSSEEDRKEAVQAKKTEVMEE